MQHIDCLLKFGDVHHAVDATRVLDADFFRAGTHTVERLPVGRLKPGLDLPQLEACFLPGILPRCPQVVVGRPNPPDLFFVVQKTVCINFYTRLRRESKEYFLGAAFSTLYIVYNDVVLDLSHGE